jgi:hypothetical protein
MGHWLLIFIRNKGSIIFFDSFGFKPSFYGGKIEEFCLLYTRVRIGTQSQIQHSESLVCGCYCIYVGYYLCKGAGIDQILKLFTKRFKRKNDAIVENFTYKILGLKQTCSKMLCSSISFHTMCRRSCYCKRD